MTVPSIEYSDIGSGAVEAIGDDMEPFRFIIGFGLMSHLAEWPVGAIMAKQAVGCLKNLTANVKRTHAAMPRRKNLLNPHAYGILVVC